MKYIFILVLVVVLQPYINAKDTEMTFIREHFYMAVEDEDALIKLENYLTRRYSEDISVYPPVILAYKGALEALKAKHAFSPFSKFSYLMSSLDLLDEAVKQMPVDLEVRFLRFSILHNIPAFLGYNEEKKSDKEVVIRELLKNDFSSVDMKTQKGIIEYLIQEESLSEQEKMILTNKCIAFKEE